MTHQRRQRVTHGFVDHIPTDLEEGIVYIALEFGTVVHRCCCGCGEEVVTPLSPTDWRLIYDGETVSLYPSIGNWGLACRSHYWIFEGRVQWAEKWPEWKIRAGREADQQRKDRFYEARRRGERPESAEALRDVLDCARFDGGRSDEEE